MGLARRLWLQVSVSIGMVATSIASPPAFTTRINIHESGPTLDHPRTWALNDLDDDGDVDFVVWENVGRSLRVFVSSGGPTPSFELLDLPQHQNSIAEVIGVGDVDGDGLVDIVVTWAAAKSIGWFKNLGGNPITFESRILFSDPSSPTIFQQGAMGDIDGDGDIDIIAAAGSRTYFSRSLLAQGGGVNWQTSWFSGSIRNAVLADVDGDSDLDVVAVQANGALPVYLERQPAAGGGSTFVTRVVATSLPPTVKVVPGDLDGDGDIDLVSASTDDDTVRIHWNGGGLPVMWTTTVLTQSADRPADMAVADVNVDGLADVLVTGSDNDALLWFENLGGSPTAFREELVSGGSNGGGLVTAADMDGDGDLDIVAAPWADDTIRWHRNDLDVVDRVTFRKRAIAPALGANGTVAVDLDGDGVLDVADITTSPGPSIVEWRRTMGGDPLSFGGPSQLVVSGSFYSRLLGADLDNDGRSDLLVSSLFGTRVRYYHNGGGSPPDMPAYAISNRDTSSPSAVDLDGDGDLDVLVPGNTGLYWVENLGGSPPDISLEHALDPTPGQWFKHAHAADFDGDGDNDIITQISSAAPYSFLYMENAGTGNFPQELRRQFLADADITALRSADLDGDGDIDLIVGDQEGVVVMENDSAAPSGFVYRRTFFAGLSFWAYSLELADFDEDGDIDFVIGENGNGSGDSLMWLESRRAQDGSWDYIPHIVFTGLGRVVVSPADMDGDGDLDILASISSTGEIVWFENVRPRVDLTGDGAVTAQDLAYLLGSWGLCAEDATCRADLNGDRVVSAADLAQLLGAWGSKQ